MARKRPQLIPVFDSVIQTHLLRGEYKQWVPIHAALRADRNRLHKHLLTLRHQAGLDERITALRILDVLAWMDGRGWADKIIAGQRLPDLATAEDTRTGQTEPN
jgi:ABC-type transport system involved in cytochrome c biogenesis ATPase subunit